MHPDQVPPPPSQSDYDFIINANKPSRQPVSLPGGSSVIGRVALVGGGLIILIILFAIVKSVVGGGSNTPAFLTVVQQQQEIIHLAQNAATQNDLNATNRSFAATAQITVGSSQTQLLSYMTQQKMKFDPKLLGLKISSKTDTELTTAAAATTYNETFQRVMQSQLTTYGNQLKAAYNQTQGKNGRALLGDDYQQAQLLFNQLSVRS